MSCIEQMKYEILLEKTTYKDAREYIEKNSDEVFYVSPGYKIFGDYHIIGVPPVALGARGNALIFTYTKPCHGTFVLTVDNENSIKEIDWLRKMEKENVPGSPKKGKPSQTSKISSTSYQDMWKK